MLKWKLVEFAPYGENNIYYAHMEQPRAIKARGPLWLSKIIAYFKKEHTSLYDYEMFGRNIDKNP